MGHLYVYLCCGLFGYIRATAVIKFNFIKHCQSRMRFWGHYIVFLVNNLFHLLWTFIAIGEGMF